MTQLLSSFLLVNQDTADLPNSQVLTTGTGLQLTSTGPGGTYNMAPTLGLLSLVNLSSTGIMTFNNLTKTVSTTFINSDSTITVSNANGVDGVPSISVNPFTTNQLVSAAANNGSSVGAYPELNFIGLGTASVSVTANPFNNRIDVAISGSDIHTGTVTSVATSSPSGTIALSGSPITTSGTLDFDLHTTAVTPGSYTNTNLTVDTYGRITTAFNGSAGSDQRIYPPSQLAQFTMQYPNGAIGSNLLMSANTTNYFDTATVNTNSAGFFGGVFDGRYIYLVPYQIGSTTYSGQITRYDTSLPFGSAGSYAVFDTATVNANSKGFAEGVFDGRYIYLVPEFNSSENSGQITRYDTTLPFGSSGSYAVFDTTTVNANSKGFVGGVFDGRYLYLVPYFNGSYFGQITRYDTSLPFGSSGSYAVFDTTTVNTNSKGFFGGVFDGRYVYLVPYANDTGFQGQITRYDTTLPFGSSGSYAVFDTATVNMNSVGFFGGVFDGRYLYLVPNHSASAYSGQITRYDTTLPFGSSGSYAVFDTATVNANSKGFRGGVFDGRYLYLVPYANGTDYSGQITRYDTSLPFGSSGSYAVFDTTTVNTNSKGFNGGVFDGRYVYLVPYQNNSGPQGQITRINAYSGPAVTVEEDERIYPPSQLVQFTMQYPNGAIGSNLLMSANTTNYFDTATVNTNSAGFFGGVFDGRYIYLVPFYNESYFGQITRYDTTLPFGSSGSYAVFDTATVNANSAGFQGGVFDGRYLYLVPSYNGTGFSGQITRYDTTLPFGSSGSYAVFDTTTVNANSRGFVGGVFDGRYVYLVPNRNASGYFGQITRYDTSLPFGSSGSYAVFDTATVNTNSKGFNGGVFDGRYIYLIPFYNGSYFGQITRYDTTLPFGSAGSYAVFDTTTVNANSAGFQGGVFDGRYIYLVPYFNGSYFGQITRYDTTLPFGSAGSYAVFDTATVNANSAGFQGGVFDGRYLYLVPYRNNSGPQGQITRYDTTLPFGSSGSYAVFDTATVNANSAGFQGGVFDGRYLYLVPNYSGQITRINAYSGPAVTVEEDERIYPPSQLVQFTMQYPNGAIGSNLLMSANTTNYFDTATVNTNSAGFFGGVFDGRYIYLVPYQIGSTTYSGQITRYDTSLPFGSAGSYAVFDTATVNANSKGFVGGVFDGRYIYLVPYSNGSGNFGQITRYDTTLPFVSAGSYAVFDTATVNANSAGFQGGVFDGRYLYLVPSYNNSGPQGQITRYDTTLPFVSAGSYAVFDTATVNANSKGFVGGVFDGRYVYLVPYANDTGIFGQITRYDTTLPFVSAGSYAVFDTATVNANSKGFVGGVFDGRYVYLVPYRISSSTYSGQITRYDTTLPFGSSGSYAVFDTTTVNANSKGFRGGVFDGRYVYLVPYANDTGFQGQITRYDTSLPFGSSGSYAVFDTATVNANSAGFQGGVFDGRYLYLVPYQNNSGPQGQITRINAYSGPSAPGWLIP